MSEGIRFDTVSGPIWVLASLLARTWRYRYTGPSPSGPFGPRSPGAAGRIFCFWHTAILPVFYLGRNRGLTALISASRDGTRLSAVLQRWGYGLIRGSSSRDGQVALRQCVDLVSAGRDIIITPDGPRGPASKMKRGVAQTALESGAAIVPIACKAERCWRLQSWDRFTIPWPFSAIQILAGEPIDPAPYRDLPQPLASLIPVVEQGLSALG